MFWSCSFALSFQLTFIYVWDSWLNHQYSQCSSRVIAFRGWSQWLVAMTILNLINGIPSPQLTWRLVITRHVKSHGFGLPDNQPPRNSLTWFEVFVLEEILWCHIGGHDKTHLHILSNKDKEGACLILFGCLSTGWNQGPCKKARRVFVAEMNSVAAPCCPKWSGDKL